MVFQFTELLHCCYMLKDVRGDGLEEKCTIPSPLHLSPDEDKATATKVPLKSWLQATSR